MISNRCARKSLLINCNSIISKNYLRFLVDNNDIIYNFFIKILEGSENVFFINCHLSFVMRKGRGENILHLLMMFHILAMCGFCPEKQTVIFSL